MQYINMEEAGTWNKN